MRSGCAVASWLPSTMDSARCLASLARPVWRAPRHGGEVVKQLEAEEQDPDA